MKRKRLIIFLVCNLLMVALELVGLGMIFNAIGMGGFVYYTQLSNILLLVAAVVNVVFAGRLLWRKKGEMLMFAWRLFYAATSVTSVTFLVVVLVLSWMYGDLMMVLTEGSMLYTHTLCPLIAFFAFEIFAPKKFGWRDVWMATGLTLAYGVVTVVLNILRVIEGPYPFLMVYKQSVVMSVVWIAVIVGGAYAVAWGLIVWKLRKAKGGARKSVWRSAGKGAKRGAKK